MKKVIRFYKENSYQIIRCMINQLGITVFALIISGVTQRSNTALLLGSIFSILFYLFLLYTIFWEKGAQDALRIEGGRLNYDPLYGFKAAACANFPNIFLGILTLIGFVFGCGMLGMNFSFAKGLYGFASLILSLIEAMYIGLMKFMIPQGNYHFLVGTVLYLLISLPSVLVSGFAYILGKKNIRFLFYDPISRKKQK